MKKMILRLLKAVKGSNSGEKDSNYSRLSQKDLVDEKVTPMSILSSLEDDAFWTSNAISMPKGLLGKFLDSSMMSLIDSATGGFDSEDTHNSYLLGGSDTG
jgi:hypothetical protein